MWRSRVTGLEYHKAGDLQDHPLQWKIHPDFQRQVLSGVLERVGIADVLLAYRDGAGNLVKVDGHARSSLDPEQTWPVIILDITAEESNLLLAAHDRLAAMSATDGDKLLVLLEAIPDQNDKAISALLAELDHEAGQTALSDYTGAGGNRTPDRQSMIKAVIHAQDIGAFEAAILAYAAATGERNRGQAIAGICRSYLDSLHGDTTERQLNAALEGLAQA